MRIHLVSVLFAVILSAGTVASAVGQRTLEWQTACEAGAAKKCYDLARAYRNGKEGLPKDAVRSGEFYTKACTKESPPACQEYGEALLAGLEGIGPDTAVAIRMLDRACNLDPEGKAGKTAGMIGGRRRCQTIVELHQKVPPKTRADSVAAKVTVGRACNRGEVAAACTMLTGPWRVFPDSLALDDSVKQRFARDSIRVRDSLRVADSLRAVEAGRVRDSVRAREARIRDSLRADSARRIRDPDARRRRQLTNSCDDGNAKACADAADLWRRGRGGPADATRARTMLNRACSLDPQYCPSEKRPPGRG